ncbi:catalase [Sphaerisporangium siamense]|uniref:Catalase n=1 Tax=Sphaerisporangium siamense TaxID=795645 RepID=A0A7W7D569_9ACTN|nr:catalase [Sphaerisporangium siamense]MBB4700515.1 catalase [Sphaerisporangium siamense]GII88322.1 catalase [Sphaerisporangium siamense]
MTSDDRTAKDRQLEAARVDKRDSVLTTDQGIPVDDTDNSLKAGERGPTIMDDFNFREKVTHFDHERIPERVVHARGSGAYGYFEPYDGSLATLTKAKFLTTPGLRTPVFVRFSTVAGSRGSADTVRDVRGFATKFYTEQGNFDLVGNNMPVFFIQDGVKFPDFVHAVKPEPDNEIPQASSAHDTLWDFVQLQPETTHMMMWLMSDRALPRSFRMMQGFGVHTFRLVNEDGAGTFVKFHWTPKLGKRSLVWDETQKIAGKDPDFNRRDLWESIEMGAFPEWELGLQLVPEEDEFAFDFDLLDATKIIPEERVPLRPVGRLVLNRNPDNFFAETEQVAFHLANVVPGIDFTNDPLLQGRLFSYLDTQLIRLGGPNFPQIPVNRPIAEVRNNQRDAYHQMRIDKGKASYHPNSLDGGWPEPADGSGYQHYQERVDGWKIKKRSESFADHYGQATLFWNSMSDWEREHIVAAFRFELGKVKARHVQEGVVRNLNEVDHDLAVLVAEGIGVEPPGAPSRTNHGRSSPALSMDHEPADTIATRKIAFLVADGVDASHVRCLMTELTLRGAVCETLAARGGAVRGVGGEKVMVTRALPTTGSVLYDAVVVPGGRESVRTLAEDGDAVHFLSEAYKHGKAVGAIGEGAELLDLARVAPDATRGVIVTGEADTEGFLEAFVRAVAAHRFPRRATRPVPA